MSDIAPFNGFGLGLRRPHFANYLEREVPVDFVEIISENFMVDGGRPLATLDAIRERYSVVMHGVSMSIGSVGGLDPDYLSRLKALADRVRPLWISDHLCWTGFGSHNTHDLLPLPYSEEALDTVCANVILAQDVLERPMVFENPSSYVSFAGSGLTEWEFLAEMCDRTGCYLLLDVNNIFVSSRNHGFDPAEYLDAIPADRVRQIHLAGHSQRESMLIDTHDSPVTAGVWSLYEEAVRRVGPVATMIERDDEIPPLDALLDELAVARRLGVSPADDVTDRRAA